MAKETLPSDSSLPLHEVLEAEFVTLHGQLPPNYPSSSEQETRLKGLWAAVHALKEKRAALCISGGGIRSATFGPVARTMMENLVRAPRVNGATDYLYPYRNFIGMRLMFKIETSELRRLTANRLRPRMSAPCHSRSLRPRRPRSACHCAL